MERRCGWTYQREGGEQQGPVYLDGTLLQPPRRVPAETAQKFALQFPPAASKGGSGKTTIPDEIHVAWNGAGA